MGLTQLRARRSHFLESLLFNKPIVKLLVVFFCLLTSEHISLLYQNYRKQKLEKINADAFIHKCIFLLNVDNIIKEHRDGVGWWLVNIKSIDMNSNIKRSYT
jgi:hypothetical protein